MMTDKQIKRRVVLGTITLVGMITILSSYVVIPPGYVGVMFNRWSGSLQAVPQGLALKMPFATTVQSYPVALRTYTMVRRAGEGNGPGNNEDDSVDLPTFEGQHVKQDLSVTYNTSPERAADVFKSFRGSDMEEIENTFVRRTIITIAQNVSGKTHLSEVISTGRDSMQLQIEEALKVEFDKMGFHVDKVNMGATHLPESLEAQMQEKMKRQQEAQQAEYELQKQKTLAKAAVEKAHGEADSVFIQAEAQSKANALLQRTLTAELVRVKAIEKWNGQLPQISGGGTPILDMRGLIDKGEK